MKKWNIVCDSSCDLLTLDHLSPDCEFNVAPLSITFGNQTFMDDASLNRELFLKTLSTSKDASSSSCPAPFDWMCQFEKAEHTIAITISSELSGAYNSAVVAKDMFLEKFPDKKVHIINSRSTSGTMILLAKKVNELIGKNLSFTEVVNEIEKYNNEMQLVFCLQNYNTLIKNGRMSPLVGAVATALGIRAIAIKSAKGDIQVVSKQRGDQNTYKYMVAHMAEKKTLKDATVYINHCENAEGAHMIKNYLKELHGCVNVTILETRGLCSYYANIGGIIVSY